MNDSNVPVPAPEYKLQDNLVYMFKDAKWVSKILLGALIGIVPILNFATTGYAIQVIRNIRDDQAPPLPEWSGSMGKFFTEGLKLLVIGLLYSIPIWILSLILIPLFNAQNSVATVLGVLIVLVEVAFALLLLFWFQGVMVNFANKGGTIGSGLAIGDIWAIIRQNMGRMLVTLGVVFLASLVVGIVSIILGIIPCIGWIAAWLISFAAVFYVLLVYAYNCGYIAKSR